MKRMASSQTGLNSYVLTRDLFYARLINQAGLAYHAWHVKRISEERYASEDSPLTYAHIHQARDTARKMLKNYFMDFIELHDLYLQSNQTEQYIKRQAKSFLKTYSGEPGHQEEFEAYFETGLSALINQHLMGLSQTDYAPDSSDDEDGGSENNEQETMVVLSKMKHSSYGLISAFLADFRNSSADSISAKPTAFADESSGYCLIDDEFGVQDNEALEHLIAAFDNPLEKTAVTMPSMILEEESDSRPLVDRELPRHEPSGFSQRSAPRKRVTFFNAYSGEPVEDLNLTYPFFNDSTDDLMV